MNNYIVVGFERIIIISIKLLSLILLMRYLSVNEMGVIAILAMFLGISSLLIDSGFSGALLRKEVINQADYDFLFTNSLIISLITYFASILISAYIGYVNSIETLITYTSMLMLVVFLRVKNIVGYLFLIEKGNFRLQTKISNLSLILGFFILVICLKFGLKIYSYVIQVLFEGLVAYTLYARKLSFKNKLNFAYKENTELIKIAYSTLASSAIRTFYDNFINLVVLNSYGLKSLGLYSQANRVNSLFVTSFMGVVDKVSFVKLTRIDTEKSIRLFNTISLISTLIAFSVLTTVIMTSEYIIRFFFSAEWLLVVPIISYTSIIALFSIADLNIRVLIKSKLSPKNILFNEIIKKTIAFPIIIYAIYENFKINNFLVCLIFISFISVVISLVSVLKFINYNFKTILIYILLTILASLLIYLGDFSV